MKAFVTSYACEQRNIEAKHIAQYFQKNGLDLVLDASLADISVVVTCGVDTRSADESIALVRQTKSQLPQHASLIIGGCLPKISPQRFASYSPEDTFSPRDMARIDEIVGKYIDLKVPFANIPVPSRSDQDASLVITSNSLHRENYTPREEFDLAKMGCKVVIDYGCLLNCSYCVIKYATGRLVSKEQTKVKEEFMRGVASKEQTIILMGGDTGAYGKDINTTFYNLLDDILPAAGDSKVYVHDFNANWLIAHQNEYARIARDFPHTFRAATIPVQSGSNNILRKMKRPYSSENAASAITGLKSANPNLLLGSHIIVGFPGETSQDFKQTLKFLDNVSLDFLTCFGYSDNPLASSSKLEGRVETAEIQDRIEQIKQKLGSKVTIFA